MGIAEIRKIIETDRKIIGTKLSLKNMRLGRLAKVFVTANCPAEVKQEIRHFAALANAEVEELQQSNEELGVICKKPFPISVVGVLKGV